MSQISKDEEAPMANSEWRMVKPICFAVFRLITNSNFVGCSTGRSAVDKFGNGFLEHLKPLSPWFPGKGCNASDIAARTTKAHNQAFLDRIGASSSTMGMVLVAFLAAWIHGAP